MLPFQDVTILHGDWTWRRQHMYATGTGDLWNSSTFYLCSHCVSGNLSDSPLVSSISCRCRPSMCNGHSSNHVARAIHTEVAECLLQLTSQFFPRMEMSVFRNNAPSSLVRTDWLISLMIEAVCTSVTSVNFYHNTQENIPEDCPLHSCRHEILES